MDGGLNLVHDVCEGSLAHRAAMHRLVTAFVSWARTNLLAESLSYCPRVDRPQEQDGIVTLWGQEASRLHARTLRAAGALSISRRCMGLWGSVAARTEASLPCVKHSHGT